jgi:hypothetical protein
MFTDNGFETTLAGLDQDFFRFDQLPEQRGYLRCPSPTGSPARA